MKNRPVPGAPSKVSSSLFHFGFGAVVMVPDEDSIAFSAAARITFLQPTPDEANSNTHAHMATDWVFTPRE
jgi:hypothetical protein